QPGFPHAIACTRRDLRSEIRRCACMCCVSFVVFGGMRIARFNTTPQQLLPLCKQELSMNLKRIHLAAIGTAACFAALSACSTPSSHPTDNPATAPATTDQYSNTNGTRDNTMNQSDQTDQSTNS